MKIVLVRHGETEGNIKGLYEGRSEVSISENGKKQALKLGELLKRYKFSKVYSSPQRRCKETLDIITEKLNNEAQIIYDDKLREIDFGLWEGLDYKGIEELFPGEWSEFMTDFQRFTFPKGEKFEEFYCRSVEFVEYLKLEEIKGNILIVTHGGVIRAILSYLMSLGMKGFYSIKPKQGAYSEINYFHGGHIEIEYINKD